MQQVSRAVCGTAAAALAMAACTVSSASAPPTELPPVERPYSRSSVWNTMIAPRSQTHPESDRLVATIGERLTSDPTQYTMAVYETDPGAEPVTVRIRGNYSDVHQEGRRLQRSKGVDVDVPLPVDAGPPHGSDGHIVVHQRSTGDEWGLWQARRLPSGAWEATNGYHYDTDWSGVPPTGFGSRGSGVPYLAGLVRRHEIERGLVDHVIAFAYPSPSCAFVWPATKSDGKGQVDVNLPEGSRLQLDPTLDREDFQRWGLDRTGRIIARALQDYGMVVVDVSGRPKIYLEAQHSAMWPLGVDAQTVAGIPLSAFRVVASSVRVSTASCR